MNPLPSASIARELLRLAFRMATDDGDADIGDHAPQPETANSLYLAYFRRMLYGLDRGLTPRELDVCARAMIGMTAEGTAIDLNIKKSSVVTYRRRAYERLGISSQNELVRMVVPVPQALAAP